MEMPANADSVAAVLYDLELYAAEWRVPIMQPDGIESLLARLEHQRPAAILEIGTAIGYSAIRMAQRLPDARIATIEREEARASLAKKAVERANLSQRIAVIEGDALEIELDALKEHSFDALFIDAAKGQYQRFFDRFSPLVPAGGVIYCDNMDMGGLTHLPASDVPKRYRSMVRKLNAFRESLLGDERYECELAPVGDGLLIARKKETN